jgi:MATE family multidrug resistance protein
MSAPVSSVNPEFSAKDISYRRIFDILWPVLISQLSFTLMGILDTVMVGRLGVVELAAVGLGNFLVFWFMSFFFGMNTGVNTLVAQAVGANDPKNAGIALGQGLYLAVISTVVMLACLPAVPTVVGWTQASAELQAEAIPYMQVRIFAAIFYLVLGVFDNFYRGLGETRLPMVCGIAQLVLNFFFNWVLIYGNLGAPAMGTVGAAWGTAAAQAIVAIGLGAILWLAPANRRTYHLATAWPFRWPIFRTLSILALPIGLQIFLEMGGITVFTALVAQLGADQLAATNAVISAWSAAFMTALSFSVVATTLAGQAIGAGRPDLAREGVRRTLQLGMVVTLALGVCYVAFPEQLISYFVAPEELGRVLPYARPLFLVVAACIVFDLYLNVYAGALRGAGDVRYALVINLVSAWVIFVPATYFAIHRWGLLGAWCCLIVHTAFFAFMLYLRYRGDAWIKAPILQGEAAA